RLGPTARCPALPSSAARGVVGHTPGGDLMEFAQPLWLLLAIPGVVVVALRLGRLPPGPGPRVRRLIQALLLSASVAVALALAGLELRSRTDRMAVVYAVDVSRSAEQGELRGGLPVLPALRTSI